jgi:predicted ATP-dependent protease
MFAVGQSLMRPRPSSPTFQGSSSIWKRFGDLVENVAMFVMKPEGEDRETSDRRIGGSFERYGVNVLVSHAGPDKAAPIVEELHPTLANLIGSIEYVSQHGVLVTNFRLIKPGAAHRANGGFLLLDVRHLLLEPFSWTALEADAAPA